MRASGGEYSEHYRVHPLCDSCVHAISTSCTLTLPGIESICEFGATARGTADDLSDKDVLVVASEPERVAELKAYWTEQGWSVAAYLPSRFDKMCEQGSLFVQHLKLEGKLVFDKGRWLESRLRQSQPKRSYKSDASASVALALPMERFQEDDLISHRLIVADLAYVALRNFGVCHLSDLGSLSFDYREIVGRVAKDLSLTSGERNLLLTLRRGKVCYRMGRVCESMDASVGRLRRLLSKVFKDRPLGEISADTPVRQTLGGYTMLRDFEARTLANLGQAPSKEQLSCSRLGEVWSWVCDPRAYSWNVKGLSRMELQSIAP